MRLPWVKLYVGDNIADTHQLTTLEFGAYTRLVLHYYQHGCVPNEDWAARPHSWANRGGMASCPIGGLLLLQRRLAPCPLRARRCWRRQEAHQRRSKAGKQAKAAGLAIPNRIPIGSDIRTRTRSRSRSRSR